MPYVFQETFQEPTRRARLRRGVLMAAGLLAVGVAVAACGGGPSTPSASRGSSTSSASRGSTTTTEVGSSAGGATQGAGLLAYSSCMRSHGITNFPDPSAKGGIPKQGVISAEGAVSNSQVQAAQNACEALLPPGGLSGQPQTIPTQDQQDYLKATACMRSHGITNFPDPFFADGEVEYPMLQQLVNLNSPQVRQAYEICRKLIPPGLPYNGGVP
jgi:hypothetical protein